MISARLRALRALRTLFWRFDDAALRPFKPATHLAWPALRDWCLADLQAPWGLAFHSAPDMDTAAQRAASVALDLDGSDLLSACQGALGRIQLRLAVKLQDASFWRATEPGDVWDSGYVPDLQSAWQALKSFEPRRPTLIVVQGALSNDRVDALAALAKRSASFVKPVRVLLLIRPGEPALPGAAHIPA